MSEADNETLGIDFNPNLNATDPPATISGTPTVAGVNCTATYLSNADGIVLVRVTDGDYAGSVEVSCVLSDGRLEKRQIDLRFV